MSLRALQGPTGGGAPVGGSGTPNSLPIWSTATSLSNSPLSFSGSTLTYSSALTTHVFAVPQSWTLPANTQAWRINGQQLVFDGGNGYLGINPPTSPAAPLHVEGSVGTSELVRLRNTSTALASPVGIQAHAANRGATTPTGKIENYPISFSPLYGVYDWVYSLPTTNNVMTEVFRQTAPTTILTVTLTSGGSGYASGTYSQVALTNVSSSGSGATADIVVSGGIVTSAILRSGGSAYDVGDTLTCASIGGGTGFVLTVASVGSRATATAAVTAPRIGAGTTTPGYRLHVKDATNRNMIMTSGTTGMKITSLTDAGAEADIGVQGNTVQFLTGGTERARIDSAGNFSIGYTGGSWSSTFTGMFLNRGLSLMARDASDVYINSNAIYDSTNAWKYVVSGTNASAQIAMNAGTVAFYRAPAGAAGSALTWLESARIDSAGNVGIGTASPASYISASSTVLAVASPGGNLGTVRVSNTSSFASGNQAEFFASTTGVGLWGSTNCPVLFYANNVERMRLNPAGTQAQSQVAIGTSSFTSGRALTTVADIDVFGLLIGRGPGASTTNTVVGGAGAALSLTTGTSNTAIGAASQAATTSGSRNTTIGEGTGYTIQTSNDNTHVGRFAGTYHSGSSNTAVGSGALTGASGLSSGANNTAIGAFASQANTTGAANVGVGLQALLSNTNGASNVAVGAYALGTTNGGSSNIALGREATTAAAADSNQLVLGSATYYVATNGGATTYYATAGALLGYMQIRLNGANVKIPVYAP